MKTLEIQQGLHQPRAGGVAVGDRQQVGADRLAHRRVARGEFEKILLDQVAGKIQMRQPRGDAMRHGVFDIGLVENGDGEKAAEIGLAARRLLGFGANLREDGSAGLFKASTLAAVGMSFSSEPEAPIGSLSHRN